MGLTDLTTLATTSNGVAAFITALEAAQRGTYNFTTVMSAFYTEPTFGGEAILGNLFILAVFWYIMNWGASYARLDDLSPSMMAYVGAVVAAGAPAIANGYLMYKAVGGVINQAKTLSYYYNYAPGWGYIILGEFKGLLEVSFFLAVLLWGAWNTFVGLWTAYVMWEHVMNDEAAMDADLERGYKWLMLGTAMGVCSWGAAVAVAELLDNVLSFFDNFNPRVADWDNNLTSEALWVDGFFWFIQLGATLFVAGMTQEGAYSVGYEILGLQFIDNYEQLV